MPLAPFRVAQVAAPVVAVLYFVSFILPGTMIMLNLFIGIIMNNMSTQHTEMENGKLDKVVDGSSKETLLEDLSILDRQIEALRVQTARLHRRLNATRPHRFGAVDDSAAVAGFWANRVGMDPGRFVVDQEVQMDAEPAQVETECLVAPVVRLPASELNLTIVLGTPD